MNCAAHQAEIDKDASRRKLDALVLSFSGLRCPFCGDADLFVHPPGTPHWSGKRTWWTVGCDSRKCNSCWTLNEDTYESAMAKIQYANVLQLIVTWRDMSDDEMRLRAILHSILPNAIAVAPPTQDSNEANQ